ncbi:hypothetical protein B0H13DRAFT_2310298 [Mycena leptocephala]|nr:hypothetical protein B0H13DRAFT_2310298 [Mycena leptocephala]
MPKPQLPSLSDEEQDTIASLCEDALFAAWNEDSAVEDINYKLRQLWETALRIGLAHGKEEVKAVCRKEDHLARAAVVKKMEQERVWGYDVGWKLCSEVLQDRAQKASTTTLSTPSRSLSVAAIQTEPVVIPDAPLDWADDAEALPISCPHPPLTPPSPRDFSVLSSGSAKPFASLQRRRRRSPRTPLPWTPSPSIRQRTKYRYPQKNTHSYPTFFSPVHSTSIHQVPTQLDWDRDPRLCDLSRALTALGWVKV